MHVLAAGESLRDLMLNLVPRQPVGDGGVDGVTVTE
jgi:hypothetical protein